MSDALTTIPGKSKHALSRRAMWRIVERRETSSDFFFGVRTTGVVCRPGCPSRLPNRENVSFFASIEAARAAGFRPCKRCRPGDASAESHLPPRIARACRMLESQRQTPSLAEVAAACGYSPSQFHRLFRRYTGITPKAYAAARRTGRAQAALTNGMTVTQASYAAGYRASSRFYADASQTLG